MNVLLTGGLGYIGSHISVSLLSAGHSVVIYDNLNTSTPETLKSIKKISGKSCLFYKGDVCSWSGLEKVFLENKIDAVIHLAGLKSVKDSVSDPLDYYRNNVFGIINLCQIMDKHNCSSLIFSSSATVYDETDILPIDESAQLNPANPYGRTKLFSEEILIDLAKSDKKWNFGILRYFNPIGAHPSGYIGEPFEGEPNNLMPYILKVIKEEGILSVFGNDYPTSDGTGVRDYIHVMDLAEGHVCALEQIESFTEPEIINLGTGIGHSVLDVIVEFEKATNKKIPYVIKERRSGDIAKYYADSSYANKRLGWSAKRQLFEMCQDSWKWAKSDRG